jgi:hypothetical protein
MTQDTTDDTRSFFQRLSDAGAEVAYLEKGGFNKHFKYSFLQEAEVKRAVGAALRKHGLVLSAVHYQPIGEVTGQAATLSCGVTITDHDKNGQATFFGVGAGTDSSDKAPMKACAAALKYALTSGFLIATGDDPEDDGGTKDDKPAKKGAPKSASDDKPAKSPNADKPAPEVEEPKASPEERAKKAIEAINAADDMAALNKLRLPVTRMKKDMPDEHYEPVRLRFVERTKELQPKKETE